MLLSLVDALRCPADHEAYPLVLSVEEWSGGRVESGFLGCPVCHARYAIRGGLSDFTRGESHALTVPLAGAGTVFDGIRLAAQLDLRDTGGLVLLTPGYAMHAASITAIAQVTCLLVDSVPGVSAPMQAAGIRVLERIPLVDGSLRAAAIDTSRASPSFLFEVSRCVRDGGRIVAPADSPPPGTVRILARDENEWVGQVERHSLVIPQRRVVR